MANIKITLNRDIVDGESVTFKAPCDATEVTGIKVYYKVETEEGSTDANKTFTFRDAHCEALTNIDNLFKEGAYITVLLDTTNNYAFIQNADTNAYLESKINNYTYGTADLTEGVSYLATGKLYFVYEE